MIGKRRRLDVVARFKIFRSFWSIAMRSSMYAVLRYCFTGLIFGPLSLYFTMH